MTKTNLPSYDTVRGQDLADYTGITLVRDLNAFLQIAVIRAAVYMGDQECPYTEEFDQNDFTGSHVIAYHNGEPVGCLRIRYFYPFVKLERLAVLPKYRKSRLAFRIARAAADFCQKKGFSVFYGHARKGLEPFWAHMGGKPIEEKKSFIFSDHTYTEMWWTGDPDPTAISLDSSPYTIIAPEGRWDSPGPLERSATRGARDG